MSKILIGASVLLLTLSAVFGVLNSSKVKGLRTEMENATKARELAERARAAQQKDLKGREAGVATAKARSADTEARIASAENDLIKSQTEKATLQSKLQARESEIAELKKRVEQAGPNSTSIGGPSTAELQAQLDETRKQLENAENEKALLAQKPRGGQERTPATTEVRRQRRPNRASRSARHRSGGEPSLQFCGSQPAEDRGSRSNSEMLVLRQRAHDRKNSGLIS